MHSIRRTGGGLTPRHSRQSQSVISFSLPLSSANAALKMEWSLWAGTWQRPTMCTGDWWSGRWMAHTYLSQHLFPFGCFGWVRVLLDQLKKLLSQWLELCLFLLQTIFKGLTDYKYTLKSGMRIKVLSVSFFCCFNFELGHSGDTGCTPLKNDRLKSKEPF